MTSIFIQSHELPQQPLSAVQFQSEVTQFTPATIGKASFANNVQYIQEIESLQRQIKYVNSIFQILNLLDLLKLSKILLRLKRKNWPTR